MYMYVQKHMAIDIIKTELVYLVYMYFLES